MKEVTAMYRRIIFGLLRIWLGWQWITAGWSKINSSAWTGNDAGTAITGFLKGAVSKAGGQYPEVHGWYADLINNIALPNVKVFSFLVAYGEFLLGLALIAGMFTLFAALGSVFLNLNYLLAGTSGSNPEMLLAGVVILIFFEYAGYYGIDRFINPKLITYYDRVIMLLSKKSKNK